MIYNVPVMQVSVNMETVKVWRMPGLFECELMRATYVNHSFPKHTHEGFGVGIIEKGALGFFYRGENVVAPEGFINFVSPGEVHTGQAAVSSGWTYRMFYLAPELMLKACRELSGGAASLPFIPKGVIRDPILAGEILALHQGIERGAFSSLDAETRYLDMLTALVSRHAVDAPSPLRVGRERRAVSAACEYIEGHLQENVSLAELAEAARLSLFHFIRVFREQKGLSPHAYLMQRRLHRARKLLRSGTDIAGAACETGFADQSHLTRRFKRVFGITPGHYRNSVQDA